MNPNQDQMMNHLEQFKNQFQQFIQSKKIVIKPDDSLMNKIAPCLNHIISNDDYKQSLESLKNLRTFQQQNYDKYGISNLLGQIIWKNLDKTIDFMRKDKQLRYQKQCNGKHKQQNKQQSSNVSGLYKDKDIELKNREAQINKLKKEIEKYKVQRDNQYNNRQNKTYLNQLQKQIQSKNKKITQLQSKLKQYTQKITQLNHKYHNAISQLKSKLSYLQKSINQFKSHILSSFQKLTIQSIQKLFHQNKPSLNKTYEQRFPLFYGNLFYGFKGNWIKQQLYNTSHVYFSPKLSKKKQLQSQCKQYSQLTTLRNRLIKYIEQELCKKIACTKLIHQYDKLRGQGALHKYVDNCPNFVFIVKLPNGNIIAVFSSEPLCEEGTCPQNEGFLAVLNSQKIYHIEKRMKGARLLSYNPYYIVFGNSQLRVKLSQNQIFSNFGIAQTFFRPKQGPQNLFGFQTKQTQFQYYQFHQVFFQ